MTAVDFYYYELRLYPGDQYLRAFMQTNKYEENSHSQLKTELRLKS